VEDFGEILEFLKTTAEAGSVRYSNYRHELFEVRMYYDSYEMCCMNVKRLKKGRLFGGRGSETHELTGNMNENVMLYRTILKSDPKATTNSPLLMYYTFGIEATCNYLIKQMEGVISGVLYRHFELLVDTMCYSGMPVSIKTTDVDDESPISKASFEKVLSAFVEGALRKQVDEIETIASKISIGKRLDDDLIEIISGGRESGIKEEELINKYLIF
jgi:hypothetical protein